MKKEELVEMINSTINTNGSGAITGEALNLALQAIVETMGTGSGSGAEKLQGYFDGSAWQQTEAEKALNAQLYTKIVSAIGNDQPISVWGKGSIGGNPICLTSLAIVAVSSTVRLMFLAAELSAFILSPDGSVSVQIGG